MPGAYTSKSFPAPEQTTVRTKRRGRRAKGQNLNVVPASTPGYSKGLPGYGPAPLSEPSPATLEAAKRRAATSDNGSPAKPAAVPFSMAQVQYAQDNRTAAPIRRVGTTTANNFRNEQENGTMATRTARQMQAAPAVKGKAPVVADKDSPTTVYVSQPAADITTTPSAATDSSTTDTTAATTATTTSSTGGLLSGLLGGGSSMTIVVVGAVAGFGIWYVMNRRKGASK